MEVAVEVGGRARRFQALNVSAGGAYLAGPGEPPPRGGRVEVLLSLPPDGVLRQIRGRVVRHAGSAEPAGFAVEFERADAATLSVLRRFVHRRAASS
jgi:hypothetical protein